MTFWTPRDLDEMYPGEFHERIVNAQNELIQCISIMAVKGKNLEAAELTKICRELNEFLSKK